MDATDQKVPMIRIQKIESKKKMEKDKPREQKKKVRKGKN